MEVNDLILYFFDLFFFLFPLFLDVVEKKNVMAERALTRLEAKLNGQEEGISGGGILSVESHVQMLIAQATDPYNLCRLFSGWQSYL